MIAVVLALASATAYGVSDFIGGLVARRVSAWSVAVVGQAAATVSTAAVAVVVAGSPTPEALAWGALAGVGSGIGTGFLYRGFARGRISVVAPVSAVGSALVPVVGGAVIGERPGALVWVGIALALPGIWAVSRQPDTGPDQGPNRPSGLGDGIVAGLGFGGLFVALAQVPDSAGLWPLTATQAASVLAVIVLAVALGAEWRPTDRGVVPALWTGPVGAAATVAFLLASQRGYLTITGVLAALYPVATVVLARLVLRERVHPVQLLGLVLCLAGVACVAAA